VIKKSLKQKVMDRKSRLEDIKWRLFELSLQKAALEGEISAYEDAQAIASKTGQPGQDDVTVE
jgi:hypothetical protein